MEGRMEKRHKSVAADIELIVAGFVNAIQQRHKILLDRLKQL